MLLLEHTNKTILSETPSIKVTIFQILGANGNDQKKYFFNFRYFF